MKLKARYMLMLSANLIKTAWDKIRLISPATYISIIALFISASGLWKEHIFPFDPEIIVTNYSLLNGNDCSNSKLNECELHIIPVIPTTIINNGYGQGKVKNISLEIIDKKNSNKIKYTSLAETNQYEMFNVCSLKNIKRGDCVRYVLTKVFSPILIEGKKGLRKDIAFKHSDSELIAKGFWKPIEYEFKLCLHETTNKITCDSFFSDLNARDIAGLNTHIQTKIFDTAFK